MPDHIHAVIFLHEKAGGASPSPTLDDVIFAFKSLIKKRLLAFIEWEERNPLEKRRAGLVDYETDPVPAREFFSITLPTKQFILDNF